jgi:hypothetical protein
LSIILIPSTKSLTVTNKIPNGNINNDIITVGSDGKYDYISYLFFDISTIPINVSILDAELVLFKVNNFYNNLMEEFCIYPISDYFSTYTTFNNRPKVNTIIKKVFHPITSKVAVTINLTSFVSLWIKNQLNITGIALLGKNTNTLAEFGSSICKDNYLIPFIKILVKPIINNCSNCYNNTSIEGTMKQIHLVGKVAPESKYAAIVNVGVKRNTTGHTDNYYVADVYDNSQSVDPLDIDRTYNIAIIPKENPGDIENVSLYGSYKE